MEPEHIDHAIRSLVRRHVPREQIAEAVGLTLPQLHDRIHALWQTAHATGAVDTDPTEQEIAERAAAVRMRWTPEELERRRMKGGPR